MLKVLCLLMGIGCPVVAQPPIWQTVFTNQTVAGVSSNFKNSGQTQHILYGTIAPGSGACSAASLKGAVMRLEGSYDNTTFTAISANAYSDNNGNWQIFGSGSFPFLRARLVLIPAATCRVDAWYTGQFPTIDVSGSVISKASGTRSVWTTLSSAAVLPILNGDSTSSKFSILSLVLTTGGTQVFDIQEYTDSSCTTLVSAARRLNLYGGSIASADGGTVTLPYIPEGWGKSGDNSSSLCISLSSAVRTDVVLKYRYEE